MHDTALEQPNVKLRYLLGTRIPPRLFVARGRILSHVVNSLREGRCGALTLGYAAS